MRDRVWSWHRLRHMHNSSILPLKRGTVEKKDGGVREDTAISGLDRGERKEERREEKKGLVCHDLSVSFFSLLDWKWRLSSPLTFFIFPVIFSFPRLAWRPCNSQLPLQLPWLFFSPVFSAFVTACSQYPSLHLTVTYTSRECSNGFLKLTFLREKIDVQSVTASLIAGSEMAYSYKSMFLGGCSASGVKGSGSDSDYMWMARKPCYDFFFFTCRLNCVIEPLDR